MTDEQPTVDCFVNTCGGEMQVLVDGSALCTTCGFLERQWCEPIPDEPASNAVEFSGYVDGIVEYVHCDFTEWYEDYLKLLDVYYKRQRGWPSEEAKHKFNDLYMMAPVKFVQMMNERAEQLEDEMRVTKKEIVNSI